MARSCMVLQQQKDDSRWYAAATGGSLNWQMIGQG
jgi:hypothetical protein